MLLLPIRILSSCMQRGHYGWIFRRCMGRPPLPITFYNMAYLIILALQWCGFSGIPRVITKYGHGQKPLRQSNLQVVFRMHISCRKFGGYLPYSLKHTKKSIGVLHPWQGKTQAAAGSDFSSSSLFSFNSFFLDEIKSVIFL